jgi:GT2 family glycosyltransferase
MPDSEIPPDAPPEHVALVVVGYNAFWYSVQMLRSLRKTVGVSYELVVVDNDSRALTRLLWTVAKWSRQIDRLALLGENTFFAEGNNVGVAITSRRSTHVLLLNSDTRVLDPRWLRRMLDAHERGATGLGYAKTGGWPRADGFCFLVDKDLYHSCGGLDEAYPWWGGVTGLEARLLKAGYQVAAVEDYSDVLFHAAGKSGKSFKKAKKSDYDADIVRSWFDGRPVKVIDRLK